MMGRCGFGDVDSDDAEDGDEDDCDAGGDDDDGHAGVVVQNAIASSEERDNAKRRTDCPLSKTLVPQLHTTTARHTTAGGPEPNTSPRIVRK